MNELANHLWQSTMFAAAIGIATAALRRNRARVRYWLWLAASLKFLLPFWLLVSIGNRVEIPAATHPMPVNTVEQISTYFAPAQEAATAIPAATVSYWPMLLGAAWLAGVLFLLLRWFRRWRMIHRAARGATVVSLEQAVPILSSPILMEPGVFGIFRPVLLLPEGITSNLTPGQFEAILAHELCHVRHRDNLTAALHMCVETLFWFHPLVWWIGARLVAERERDCDEGVLQQGAHPSDYAHGLLNVCRCYAESPLPCTSGVTGAELKQRIREIMTQRRSLPMTFVRKAALAAAGLAAIVAPLMIGVVRAQEEPRFEVASVKPAAPRGGEDQGGISSSGGPGTRSPERFTATNISLPLLMIEAYDVKRHQIVAPGWMDTTGFDVNAKIPPGATRESFRLMLQNLLADRFKMVIHRETKESQVFDLVQVKSGHNLKEYVEDPPAAANAKKSGRGAAQVFRPGMVAARIGGGVSTVESPGMPMTQLVRMLSNYLAKPVFDATGLPGKYNVKLHFSTEGLEGGPGESRMRMPARDAGQSDGAPTLFNAVQEQLGLKLVQRKGTIEIIVIDKAERTPAAN